MKKFLLPVIVAISLIGSAHAQIEKGSVLVGCNAGFQFKKTDKTFTEMLFSISPMALYHPIKYIGLGGQLSYIYYYTKHEETPQTVVSARNIFSIGPVVRVNIPVSNKTVVFIHHGFNGGIDVTRDPTNDDKSYASSAIINWRWGPGLSIFATRNVAVELGIFYDGMKEVTSIKQKKEVLLKGDPVFTHGLTIALGFQVYFHKKEKETPVSK